MKSCSVWCFSCLLLQCQHADFPLCQNALPASLGSFVGALHAPPLSVCLRMYACMHVCVCSREYLYVCLHACEYVHICVCSSAMMSARGGRRDACGGDIFYC